MKKLLIFFVVMAVIAAAMLCGCSDNSKKTDDEGTQPVVEKTDDTAVADTPDDEKTNDIENNDEVKTEAAAETDKTVTAKKDAPASDTKTKSQKKSQTKPSSDTKKEEAQSVSWPSNEYTRNVPKPSAGSLQETGFSDGIYCLRLSGVSISDAKSYAASLMSSGYTSDVSETISGGTYLFGGGNSNGVFTVVSFNNGQMIIGIQL